MPGRPIYVEIRIRSSMDELWRHTQTPDLHAPWDLRFTDIEYLPRANENEPQRFLYRTRIGFGMEIRGEGETLGSRDGPLARTSALKFWSEDSKSLIRTGSGYWKYIPTSDGIRFLTQYDYDTRFGKAGQLFDSAIFRPLIGWATAWSFDRLRLWLEEGLNPAVSMTLSLVHATSRVVLGMVWIYQGVVPKLLFKDSGELAILRASSLLHGWEPQALTLIGIAEVAFGLLLLIWWRKRSLFLVNIVLLILLGAGALFSQAALFTAPFNPFSLNLAMIGLGLTGYWSGEKLPSATHCLRERPKGTP